MLLDSIGVCAVKAASRFEEWGRIRYQTMALVLELEGRGYTIFNSDDYEEFESRCEEIAQLFAMKDEAKALVACRQFFSEVTGRILP